MHSGRVRYPARISLGRITVGIRLDCRDQDERHARRTFNPDSMKLTTFICISAFAATLLLPMTRVAAQAPPTPSPGSVPSVSPPQPSAQVPKKITSLRIKSETMKDAVAELLDAAKAVQLPEINVLYAPGAEEVAVPELNLRNVNGSDALRLIAVSANCEAEPIGGENASVIGYMIRQKGAPPRVNPSSVDPSIGKAAPSLVPMTSRKTSLDPTNARASVSVKLPEAAPSHAGAGDVSYGSASEKKFGGGSLPTVASEAVFVNVGNSPPAVRVYPLGGVTTMIKFSEIEATLRDVLKAEGIAPDTAKLALHEKTNVLVVTGTSRVHELVTELLDALRKNQTDAQAANDLRETALREVTDLRIRLDAEQQQKAKLGDQLGKSEAQLRELDQELGRLKATAVKPPSAR
jgi:hypothetical protein